MATRKSAPNQSADVQFTTATGQNRDCDWIPPAESIQFQSLSCLCCGSEHMDNQCKEVVHNDDDFLNVIVMAEEGSKVGDEVVDLVTHLYVLGWLKRFQDHGYKEGFSLGKRSGFEQGKQTGHVKGREVGSEVGFYLGFVTAWKALLEKQEERNNPRVTKALESLLSMLKQFPVDNPNHEGLWEDLKRIRAKFKQVASLVNITINASDDKGSNTKPTMSF